MINIETDSTIKLDVTKDLEQFNQLVTATATWAQAVIPAIQIMPETRVGWFELLGSQLSKFRFDKRGEDAIDKLIDSAAHPPVQDGAQAQMSPEEMQAQQQQQQHEQVLADKKLQQTQAKSQGDIAKIEAQTNADKEAISISAQQSVVDNQNADKALERDVILANVQAKLGINAETAKQQTKAMNANSSRPEGNGVRPPNGAGPQPLGPR